MDGEEEDNDETDEPSYEHNFHGGQHDIIYQNQFSHWKSPAHVLEVDATHMGKGMQWMTEGFSNNAIEPQMSMFDQLTDEEDPKFVNQKMKFMKFNKFGKYSGYRMFPEKAIGEDDDIY